MVNYMNEYVLDQEVNKLSVEDMKIAYIMN